MPRYAIDGGQLLDVVDRHHINKVGVWQVIERYAVDPVTKSVRLVWEWITGYLFTSDGFALKTEDNYILKCQDQ